jgi:hypothetical protein
MYDEYNILIGLLQNPNCPLTTHLLEAPRVYGRSGGSGRSRHSVRVTFTGHSPAQPVAFAAACPIRFVNRVASSNQVARMLNQLWEVVATPPAAQTPLTGCI